MQITPISISTLPKNPNDTYSAWLYHVEQIKDYNTSLTWSKPLPLLKLKLSSPGQVESDAVLSVLNNHIAHWKTEKSPDITHFKTIIDNNRNYKSILLRTLYECMERNELNTGFIQSNSYVGFMFDSNFVTCGDLLNIGKYKELDKLALTKDYLNCLTTSPRGLILLLQSPNSIHNSTTEKLNLSKLETRQLVTAIFANPNIYDSLLTQQNAKDLSVCIEFLFKNRSHNFNKIFSNFDALFTTKEDQLCCLAGLTCITRDMAKVPDLMSYHINALEKLTNLFKDIYTTEFKLLKTFQSLEMTDFNIILDSLIHKDNLNNLQPIELPTLF